MKLVSPIIWEDFTLMDWDDAPHQGCYHIEGSDRYENYFEATATIINHGHDDEEILSVDDVECVRGEDVLTKSRWRDEVIFIKETADYYTTKENSNGNETSSQENTQGL